MKAKNREALKYAKGILNGLTYFTPKAAGEPLATVIEILDAVLEDEAELPKLTASGIAEVIPLGSTEGITTLEKKI